VAIDRTEGAFALELRAASVRPRALAPRSARRGATRRRRRARVRRSRRGSGLAFARRSRTLFEMAGSPPDSRLDGDRVALARMISRAEYRDPEFFDAIEAQWSR